ncbi:AI-2E family transporter [Eubacteriales bacterium KG127]
MRDKFKSKYFRLWLTYFLVGVSLIGFNYIISNMDTILGLLDRLGAILFPFLLGGVLAYLLCPVYNFVVRISYHGSLAMFKTKAGTLKFARVIGSIASIFFLITVVGGVLWMIIPELIKSIINIIESAPANINELKKILEMKISEGELAFMGEPLRQGLNNFQERVVQWSKDGLIDGLDVYLKKITEGVLLTFKTILNIVVAVIVAVYLLNGKELFKAQFKKIIIARFSETKSESIFSFFNFCNKTFGGFINGKIIDSAIIGALCYVSMIVIGLPYPLLVSAIVGITNIIPFFGPFIGAVPGLFIILTVNPLQAVYFAIMILVIQQLDGNVIGPKILGGTVGLPSFWVMFAIILGGGLFGFIGMVLGVPVFAIIYYYYRLHVENRLMIKDHPVDTREYQNFDKYNIKRKELL